MHTFDDEEEASWCSPVQIGGSFLLCGKVRNTFPFQCMVGPDWMIVVLVYFLVLSINGLVLGIISTTLGYVPVVIGCFGMVVLLALYSATACSDPGIVLYNDFNESERNSGGHSRHSGEGGDIESNSTHALHPGSDEVAASDTRSSKSDESAEGSAVPLKSSVRDAPKLGSVGPAVVSTSTNNGSTSINATDDSSPEARSTSYAATRRTSAGGVNSSAPRINISMPNVPAAIECGQCSFKRPYSARHCTYCENCIDKLDHHCPWCGKCIGRRNIKVFWAFTTMLCVQLYFLIGTFVYYLAALSTKEVPRGPK